MKKQKRNKKNHFDILSQVTFKPKKKTRFVLISELILKQKDSGKKTASKTLQSQRTHYPIIKSNIVNYIRNHTLHIITDEVIV